MLNDYKNGLINEVEWRNKDKVKLTQRLATTKTTKQFNQILKLIENHTKEVDKINKIMWDKRNWT